MESKLVTALGIDNYPVAVIYSDEKPEGALEFTPGKWACVVTLFAAAAYKGRCACFSRETHGCSSGKVGLCLTRSVKEPPGGLASFLSHGESSDPNAPEPERYVKTRELAQEFIDELPRHEIKEKYVVLKPLKDVDLTVETPAVVCFYVDVDRLSALYFLANYSRPGVNNVVMTWGAGCHTLVLYPVSYALSGEPRAVVGGLDVTVRPYLGQDELAFSVPWEMFTEMEDNVDGSFLEHGEWGRVLQRHKRESMR